MAATLAQAQDGAVAAPDPIAVLDAQTAELSAITQAADGDTDAARKAELRDRGMAVGTAANAAVALLVPQLEAMDARIAELGEATDAEAPDVKAQRDRLDAERGDLDSAIKRGRLLAADAKDLIDRMILEINEAFSRDTFKLVASPLSPALWSVVGASLPDDSARFRDFFGDALNRIPQANLPLRLLALAGALAIAAVLILPVRRRLRQAGRNFAVSQVPASRARRSGLALWFVLVGTLTSALGFLAVYATANWAGFLTRGVRPLAEMLTVTATVGAFVLALGAGLLLVGKQSWRLLPIGEDAARRLRSYPGLCAVLTFCGVAIVETGRAVGVSQPAAILLNYVVAFTYCGLIVAVLVSLGRLRRNHPEGASREPSAQTTLVTLATLAAWICVVVSVVAAFQGYVNFALFLSRQTIWTAIVAAAAYLLLVVADDLCTTLLSGESRLGRSLHAGLGLRKSQVGQIGVVLSAVLRIAILVLAAILLSGPLGPGASSLFYQFGNSAEINIGGFTIVPGSILKAVVVLAVGIALMRGVRHWLDERYLPATDLDPGARNSVSTIVSYAGIILAGFWALTALGIGVERIALVVSALSVGIGFGLQAITQNFVSGLILLAERPVKIGDTVRIGTDEGDVRRISVRSTEIQIADRSTLIVPNSELITKTIRNMTLANPLGRIQIVFAAPLDVDVANVRRALLDIYAAHEAVLADPAPSVFIDGIEDGKIVFKSFAFVAGPRAVYTTRSAIFFAMLERFRSDGIALVATA
jgi:small-conductance mechanosensitive channel